MFIESWNLYFPEEQYTVFNESVNMITKFKTYLQDKVSQKQMEQIEKDRIFYIVSDEYFKMLDPELKESNNDVVIDCISCAISELLRESGFETIKITTRINNFSRIESCNSISAELLGKLVFFIGTVSRTGFKKIKLFKAYFECKKCHEVLHVNILNNVFKQPSKCKGNCKSKTFNFLYNHHQTIMRDVQEIKLQQLNINMVGDSEIKDEKMIDCIVHDDFVGLLAPGDVIQLCGVISSEIETNSLYKLIINVNNLEFVKNKSFFIEESECKENDFKDFKKISKTENIVSSLIHSLYPTIFGHELIKTGLVLSLFGGTKKYVGQDQIRSEIHILIVGDPGLGKSRMLVNSCSILPKSTYVSGNLTTTAGLTVSIAHDPATGDYMADAGALVVSDNGICCIDEFDKIDNHTALFEAMEEQKVTVAKGGIVCSVPTRSTIIAAANPRYGHFNQNKSIKDNLRFDNALLSRFDLVFILIDNLNEKENYEISDQILKRRHISKTSSNEENPFAKILSNIRIDRFLKSLIKDDKTETYPLEIIKKYIAYARCSVFPTLSRSAKEEIKKYYLEIREKRSVTTRDLESLIRITEARAKLELRTIATKEDALFSIELYKRIVESEEEKPTKKHSIKDLIKILSENQYQKKIDKYTKDDLSRIILQLKIERSPLEIIETLNYKGFLIKKSENQYIFKNNA